MLLAPLRRATVLRSAAMRQVRGVVFAGMVVGLVAGTIVFRRLPGSIGEWLAVGIGVGVLTVLAASGGGARRVGRPTAHASRDCDRRRARGLGRV